MFLGAGAALTVAACGKGSREADTAAKAGLLLVGNSAEPKTLDPQLNTGVPEARVIDTMIEGLIIAGPEGDHQLMPGAAESWTSENDLSRWIFKIRKGAKWSNGDPITADDFVYAWQRMLSPALGTLYAEMLYVIRNAEAFHRGDLTDFSQVGVKAPDPGTLVVDLKGPVPYFDQLVKHHSFYPVNPRAVEANGGMTDRQSGWATLGNYVGNGAFRLKSWITNQMIEVEKNPDYWDQANVKLNGVRFLPVENVQTEDTMFFGDQIHMTSAIQPDKLPGYRKKYPEFVHSEPSLASTYLEFNTKRKPLSDVRVRKALAFALDRKTLVERVLQGGQQAAGGLVPAAMEGYKASTAAHFDPEAARRLLAEAGYPGGKGFPGIEMLIVTADTTRKVAEVLQGMWQEHLGINVGLYNQEWKVFLDRQTSFDFDIAFASWVGDYLDASTFLDLLTTGNGNNHTQWSNARYDALMNKARYTADESARVALMEEAEALAMADMPLAPILWGRRNYLAKTYVKGLVPRLLGVPKYQYLTIES